MEETDAMIFHLTRSDGSDLFLHPFDSPGKLLSLLSGKTMGRFGIEPKVESLTRFRTELYKLTDEAVRAWIADKKFIPRFAVSALVFLVAYLLFSLVIRDPLPMIDELVLSILSASGAYYLLLRRDLSSPQAIKKRVELKNLIDSITFTESGFVRAVEEALIETEKGGRDAALASLSSPIEGEDDDGSLKDALLLCLRGRFNPRLIKREERLRKTRVSNEDLRSELSRQAGLPGFDLALFAVYVRLRQSSPYR
jgi:hypothetical protein